MQRGAAPRDGVLPPGWRRQTTRTGRTFFTNTTTGVTQYEPPTSTFTAAQPQPEPEPQPEPQPEPEPEPELPAGWVRKDTRAGKAYYFCVATGETQFERPRESSVSPTNVPTEEEAEPPESVTVVAGEVHQTAKRERWALLTEADGDQAALVLAYQRLAWATALLAGERSGHGAECALVYLPFPAMEQIAQYQHDFVLPATLIAPIVMPSRGLLLKEGFRCDARDCHGDWYPAYVAAADEAAARVQIHFVGWSQKFREWLALDEQERAEGHECRLAPLGSHTAAKAKKRGRWLAHDRWANSQGCASTAATSIWERDTRTVRSLDLRLVPACRVCNQAVDSENTVLCEGCERNIMHTYCHAPPMETPPGGIWYCADCRARAGLAAAYETDDHVAAVAVAEAADHSFGGLIYLPYIRNGQFQSNGGRQFGWVWKDERALSRQMTEQSRAPEQGRAGQAARGK
jgi:hypothetical protein